MQFACLHFYTESVFSVSEYLHEGKLVSGKYPRLVAFIKTNGLELVFHIHCNVDSHHLSTSLANAVSGNGSEDCSTLIHYSYECLFKQ